jgi:hypothetical protein
MTVGLSTTQLARLHCPYSSLRKLLVFEAYYDDGGTNRKHRIGVLAGYAAPRDEWECFDRDWLELLADPWVPYFKAHDCDKGDGVYKGVPEAKRRQTYDRAVEIVCAHRVVAIAAAGRRPDFEGDWATWVSNLGLPTHTAFDLSARLGLIHLGIYLDDHWPEERAALICEGGTKEDNETITAAYWDIVQGEQWRSFEARFTGPPAFHKKQDSLGLQAADLLAYEAGREFARLVDGKHAASPPTLGRLREHAERMGGVVRVAARTSRYTFE